MGYEKMLQDAINGLTVNNPNALLNHPQLAQYANKSAPIPDADTLLKQEFMQTKEAQDLSKKIEDCFVKFKAIRRGEVQSPDVAELQAQMDGFKLQLNEVLDALHKIIPTPPKAA